MPFSSTLGLRLHYELSGGGWTSLILIHELGGSLHSWDLLVPMLDDRFRVLSYDLRGAGESEPVTKPYSMDDQANDLEGLVEASSLTPPFLIVGAAGGSAVAVTFAARHPEVVSGLILCPPALSVTPERSRYLNERSKLASREGMKAVVDQALEKSFPPSVIRNRDQYQTYRAHFLENDPVSYTLANRALCESTADELAASLRCPSLLLAGKHDSLRPLDHVRAVAATLPGASVEVMDAAHLVSQQAPEELARHIKRFHDDAILGWRYAQPD